MKIVEGNFDASGKSFAIVSARWNDFIVSKLVSGAQDAIVRHGGSTDDITIFYCPGSYELPLICKKVAESKKFDAIIALGAVIRGATPHFDFVAGEAIKGIAQVSLENGIPISFGVITTDNIEQAIERAGTKAGNKGFEAAVVAIEMLNLIKQI